MDFTIKCHNFLRLVIKSTPIKNQHSFYSLNNYVLHKLGWNYSSWGLNDTAILFQKRITTSVTIDALVGNNNYSSQCFQLWSEGLFIGLLARLLSIFRIQELRGHFQESRFQNPILSLWFPLFSCHCLVSPKVATCSTTFFKLPYHRTCVCTSSTMSSPNSPSSSTANSPSGLSSSYKKIVQFNLKFISCIFLIGTTPKARLMLAACGEFVQNPRVMSEINLLENGTRR